MTLSVPSLQRRAPVPWLDPVAVAAYAGWLAVVAGPVAALLRGAPWSGQVLLGLAAQAAFLALFIARGVTLGERISLAAQRVIVTGMLATGLVACWAFPDGMQAMLIVLVMPALPAIFPWRVLVGLLVLVNAVLAVLMFRVEVATLWSERLVPVQLMVAYLAFQVFTLLAIVSLRQANDARDAAQRVNAELLATRRLLDEAARAEERLRLSRELHDIAGHKLTALKMQLALRRREAGPAAVGDCERLADELLTDLRGVVSAMRQHEGVGLEQALRALDPQLPDLRIWYEIEPTVRVADMRAAEALVRSAQEGLTNALRHGRAGTVRIALRVAGDGLVLEVEDDGRGRASAVTPGNGLTGLKERLRELGGSLEWSDAAPTGLRLRAQLPHAA